MGGSWAGYPMCQQFSAIRKKPLTIQEQLKMNLKEAMLAKDKPTMNVIRQIQAEVAIAKAAEGFSGEIDDDLYRDTIAGYVRKMRKVKREFDDLGERGAEQAAKLQFEIDYLSEWIDAALDEGATLSLVRSAISELGVDDPKQAGRVIGHIMKGGQPLDGALVNRLVREELSA